MSRCSAAARRSFSVNCEILTGVTIVQWPPTGQRWNLHQAKRSDFTEAPGIQTVVNRWP